MSKNTWFITGASSGLGHALARHVLKHGDKVVLGARTVGPMGKACYDTAAAGGLTSSNRPTQSCQLRTNSHEPIEPRNGLSQRKELLIVQGSLSSST